MRVTAWSRQSKGQVEAWMLRTRQRWQHPLQPNYNWHRARYDELTLECVWKQGGTDKDRITMDASSRDRQDKQATKKPGSVCHSLLSEDFAAPPPRQANLPLPLLPPCR